MAEDDTSRTGKAGYDLAVTERPAPAAELVAAQANISSKVADDVGVDQQREGQALEHHPRLSQDEFWTRLHASKPEHLTGAPLDPNHP